MKQINVNTGFSKDLKIINRGPTNYQVSIWPSTLLGNTFSGILQVCFLGTIACVLEHEDVEASDEQDEVVTTQVIN